MPFGIEVFQVVRLLLWAEAHPTQRSPMVGLAQCNSVTFMGPPLTLRWRAPHAPPCVALSLSLRLLLQWLSLSTLSQPEAVLLFVHI
jgi:hypothetical protein